MFAFHVLFWLRVSLCKNTCLVRIFRKCSHHQMCYWMCNYFNTEAYLATFSIILYLSEIKVMSKHYLGVGVSMRVFLHEVNIWIIGLSEAYCLYQCKWPAQVNISLFHSYTTACVGVSLYQPHRWQVESKALALHHGKKLGIFSVENGGRGGGWLWEPVRSAQLLPRHPLQALGWGHLRICISFVWLRRHGWFLGGFGALFWVFIAGLWLSLVGASRGCLLVAVYELLTGVTSLVAEHRFQSGEGGWELRLL